MARVRPVDCDFGPPLSPVSRAEAPSSAGDACAAPSPSARGAWVERAGADLGIDGGSSAIGGRAFGARIGVSSSKNDPADPAQRPLPDIRYDSEDPGDYYCEHVFFLAQEQATSGRGSVLSDSHGDRMVGFMHVPPNAL